MLLDLFYILAVIVLSPVLLHRIVRRGKYRKALFLRRGNVAARRAHPCRIWVHAVSVGEANVAQPFVRALEETIESCEVVVSTITETGQEVARQNFGPERVFYCPFDFSWMVRRAFRRVRPAALVLMELELWPNLIAEAHRRGVPVLLVNGRIGERSFRSYRRFRWLFRRTLDRLAWFACQDEIYAGRARQMGMDPARVVVTGNMKFDAAAPRVDLGAAAALRKELGLADDAPVILGGSTHRTEEAALGRAYQALREELPDLRLIVAPRHPERFGDAQADLESLGLKVIRHSELDGGDPSAHAASVVLEDKMGVLARLYQVATVAFIGGSLIPHGGQNVMEPAALGVPTVFGPHMFNFREAVKTLLDNDAAVQVQGSSQLADSLGGIVRNRATRLSMGERARHAIDQARGASERTAALVAEVISRQSQATTSTPAGET